MSDPISNAKNDTPENNGKLNRKDLKSYSRWYVTCGR